MAPKAILRASRAILGHPCLSPVHPGPCRAILVASRVVPRVPSAILVSPRVIPGAPPSTGGGKPVQPGLSWAGRARLGTKGDAHAGGT